ncbi:activating signal cointegrator 1 complex subunit 2-like protein [Sesbania bispinosa]|nr:activating signal cointegrator 1 complex subunit 2-like protein [Sesbania bispinosa]
MSLERITLILHHKGKFVRNESNRLDYVDGEFCVWEGFNVDTVNKFTMVELCKEHNYHKFENIYWLHPGKDLDLGLRLLDKDRHVVEMCSAAMKANGEIDIFSLILLNPPMSPEVEAHVVEEKDSPYRPPPCDTESEDNDNETVKENLRTKEVDFAAAGKGKKVASVAGKDKQVGSSKEKVGDSSSMKRGRIKREHVVQPESEDTWSDEVESKHGDEDVGGVVGHRQQYASSAGFGVNAEGPNPHSDSDDDESANCPSTCYKSISVYKECSGHICEHDSWSYSKECGEAKLNTRRAVIYQQPQSAVVVTNNMRPQVVPYPPMPTNSSFAQPSTTTSSSSQSFMQFIPTPKGPPTNQTKKK